MSEFLIALGILTLGAGAAAILSMIIDLIERNK